MRKLLLLPIAWLGLVGLSSISAYKTFTTEVLTSADLNSSFSTIITGVNDLIAKFPGDSVTVGVAAMDTLAADGDAQITLTDAIHSQNSGDSLNVHRANVERLQLDSLMFPSTAAMTVGFSDAMTPGYRSRRPYMRTDTTSVDSLTVVPDVGNEGVSFLNGGVAMVFTAGGTINMTGTVKIGGTAVTSTATEINILDGVTSTTAELNILDGVTSTADELNKVDGYTGTAANLTTLTDASNADALHAHTLSLTNNASSAFTSAVKTAENARKIIPVMLDDPATVWNLQAFMQAARNTSWWASLGAPPIHGLFIIHEDQVSVTWWNIDTDAQYLQIDGAANGIIDDATPVLTGIAFLDGRIYLSGTGGAAVTVIDLMRDQSYRYSTSGTEQYKATLGDFTGTAGYSVIASTVAIVNNTCYGIAAVRELSLVDEFGRPKHWWIVGTDGGGSIYNPVANAIYDSGYTLDVDLVYLSPSGFLINTVDVATPMSWNYLRTIFGVAADSWGQDGFYRRATSVDADLIAWTANAVPAGLAVLDGQSAAQEGMPQIWFGSDEGLYIGHHHSSTNATNGALIRLTADYASPYMKGDIRAAWPLHSTADVSPAGHTLTNNNTVTFTDGGPAGSYADFVAASSMSLSVADHADFDGMSELSVGCWFYRDIDSASGEGLVAKYNDTNNSWLLYITSNDTPAMLVEVSSTKQAIGPNSTITLGTWNYAVGVYDGVNVKVYLNGILIATTAATGTIVDQSAGVYIGSYSNPNRYFDGRIGGAFVSATAMTANEIAWEYQRGLRRLQSTVDVNDALTNVDVKSVQADPSSGHWIITHADDKLTILDMFGVPILQDTAPDGTIRDAAIWMPSGQDNPSYGMGTSTRIEFVQQIRRIFN